MGSIRGGEWATWLVPILAFLAVNPVPGSADTGRAMAVGRAKVGGQGFSVLARSAKQCLALCNLQPACDSANYDVHTKKCRVFTRCLPTTLLHKSKHHIHYTKRPMISEEGYTYHAESDSCLKLMEKVTDFAEADAMCKGQNGRLVSLTDPGINEEAAALLKRSQAQFAWIGLIDYKQEGNPLHSSGIRAVMKSVAPKAKWRSKSRKPREPTNSSLRRFKQRRKSGLVQEKRS